MCEKTMLHLVVYKWWLQGTFFSYHRLEVRVRVTEKSLLLCLRPGSMLSSIFVIYPSSIGKSVRPLMVVSIWMIFSIRFADKKSLLRRLRHWKLPLIKTSISIAPVSIPTTSTSIKSMIKNWQRLKAKPCGLRPPRQVIANWLRRSKRLCAPKMS